MTKIEQKYLKRTDLSKNFFAVCQFTNSKKFLYIVLVLLFLVTLYLINQNFMKYAILSSFVLFGVLFSLFTRKLPNKREYLISQKYGYLFLIVFIFSFSLSVLYLYLFSPLYAKPFSYYLFLGICSMSIYLISCSHISQKTSYIMPFLLILFSLNVFLSNYITFPNGTYASGDTHYQIYNIMLPILKNGTVPQGFAYSSFPLHQIYVSIASMITNLEPSFLYFFYPGILYTIVGLFIYFFSRHIFDDEKIETICVLVYTTSPDIIYHATHAYQFSYAAPLGILLLFLGILIYYPPNELQSHKFRAKYILLSILLICALVFTHQFTSGVLFSLFLILFFICIFVFKEVSISSFVVISTLFFTIIFTHWSNSFYGINSLIDIFSTYYSSLLRPENYMSAVLTSDDGTFFKPTINILFYNYLGVGILFILTVIGSLNGIQKNNTYIFLMSIYGIIIWSFVSVGSFIKMPLLLGGRLLTFFWAVSICFIAAKGIKQITKKFGKNGIIGCCLLLFIITVFNTGTPLSGPESSFLLGDTPYIKFYDTEKDCNGYDWIKNHTPEKSSIKITEPWVPQYYDSNRTYEEIPFTNQNVVDLSKINKLEYLLLTSYSSKGLRIRGITEQLQIESVVSKDKTTVETSELDSRIVKINVEDIQKMVSPLDLVYSNGGIYILYM